VAPRTDVRQVLPERRAPVEPARGYALGAVAMQRLIERLPAV